MSGRTWFYHEGSDCYVFMTWEEASASGEVLDEVDELVVPAAEREKEMAMLGLNQLPACLYHDGMPPDPVFDACRLLGIGEWATSEFRGNPDFATTLERKYPMKVWREALKKAMELQRREDRNHFRLVAARIEAKVQPVYESSGQLEIDMRRSRQEQRL